MVVGSNPTGGSGPPGHSARFKYPRQAKRIAVAIAVGAAAGLLLLREYSINPANHSDFGMTWFGAVALRHGANPYLLIGPGRVFPSEWNLTYPATAMVAAMPLSFLPEKWASLLFISLSSAVLAYLLTDRGWYRLPIFISAGFITAARAGQWSPLMTAAWLTPFLGWAIAAKPNTGTALVLSRWSRSWLIAGLGGGVLLLLISLMLLPEWPRYWVASLRAGYGITPRLLDKGGVLLLLGLLRWRRPEARLLVALALVPQTANWYEVLPLHLIPSSYRQNLAYSLVSSVGFVITWLLVRNDPPDQYFDVGSMMVAFAYLPALALVLRRPNDAGAT